MEPAEIIEQIFGDRTSSTGTSVSTDDDSQPDISTDQRTSYGIPTTTTVKKDNCCIGWVRYESTVISVPTVNGVSGSLPAAWTGSFYNTTGPTLPPLTADAAWQARVANTIYKTSYKLKATFKTICIESIPCKGVSLVPPGTSFKDLGTTEGFHWWSCQELVDRTNEDFEQGYTVDWGPAVPSPTNEVLNELVDATKYNFTGAWLLKLGCCAKGCGDREVTKEFSGSDEIDGYSLGSGGRIEQMNALRELVQDKPGAQLRKKSNFPKCCDGSSDGDGDGGTTSV